MVDSRMKGKQAEQQLAGLLRDELGVEVIRVGHGQAEKGGFDLLIGPISIEVKRYTKATDGLISEWWSQTVRQSVDEGRLGILAYRGNGQQWRFVLDSPEARYELAYSTTLYLPGFCQWYREVCI